MAQWGKEPGHLWPETPCREAHPLSDPRALGMKDQSLQPLELLCGTVNYMPRPSVWRRFTFSLSRRFLHGTQLRTRAPATKGVLDTWPDLVAGLPTFHQTDSLMLRNQFR